MAHPIGGAPFVFMVCCAILQLFSFKLFSLWTFISQFILLSLRAIK